MAKVRTMRGQILDVTSIIAKNENKKAIGNTSKNARGDILGPGGKIIKRREELAQDYHSKNPNAVRRVSLKEITPDTFLTPQEVVAKAKAMVQASQEKKEVQEHKFDPAPVQAPVVKSKKVLKDDFE